MEAFAVTNNGLSLALIETENLALFVEDSDSAGILFDDETEIFNVRQV
jgi:hypothetical protein